MLKAIKSLREWFDIVAAALKAKPTAELTLEDFRDYFATTGDDIDGTPYDPSNREHVNRLNQCFQQVLPLFQKRGLISIRYDLDRYTPRLGFHVPENVVQLTTKGRRLSERSRWSKVCYWTAAVLIIRIAHVANKYKWVITAASVAMAVTKGFLEWDVYMSGAAALAAAFVALIMQAMQ